MNDQFRDVAMLGRYAYWYMPVLASAGPSRQWHREILNEDV